MCRIINKILIYSALWLIFGCNNGLAQISLTDSLTRYVIGPYVDILDDPTHQLRTLSQVMQEPYRSQFIRNIQEIPNRGYSTHDYWVRFDLINQTLTDRAWLLEIGFGNFSEIDLFFISKQTGKVIHKQGGELLGHRSREISYNTYVFYMPSHPGDQQTVFIRLSSTFGQATFPLYIWREDAFVQPAQVSGLLWGIYYGILLSVFLYHLSLLLLIRERSHIQLLTLYLGAYILWELSRGYCLGVRFLWSGNTWLTNYSLPTFFTLMISSFLLFYSAVLDLKRIAPRLNTILYGLIGFSVAGWLLTLMNIQDLSRNLIITLVGSVNGLFICFLGAYSWQLGYRPARYYWAAAVVLVVGGFIHSLNRAGFIPGDDFFVHYTLNLGSVLEFIFLTIGLADTMRLEKKQKAQLQQEMVHKVNAAELRGLTEERERVSSEIHDNVGNSLLTLRQSLRGLQSEAGITLTYEKLERMVQETYDEVRKIVNNLLPDEFQQKGISVALQELIHTLNQSGQAQFYLLLSGVEDSLKPSTQFQLYLVIVELINNTIKHAEATEASIRFAAVNRILTISIRDNGIGLTLLSKLEGGRGWTNIRNRLERIGGSIHLDTLNEKGTSIIVHVPLTEDSDQSARI
ncbi:sensor histidine kinase [Spirosoma sp.]|uniref:sensor histidine kinase n=1 Tax=Spirosoma sp. TaxID=1899569 RepID=UPI003B3B07CC